MEHIKINKTDIFLEDFGEGKGKISITDIDGYNYSTFWGAMNSPLDDFLYKINSDYFVKSLISSFKSQEIDINGTFRNIRKHIREEIMPWYENMEFQSDMRKKLNILKEKCINNDSQEYFVDKFFDFLNQLDFNLLNDLHSYGIEKNFKSINEPWYFIETKKSREYIWLEKLHLQLKKKLKKNVKKI